MFKLLIAFVVAFLAVVSATDYPKVKVEVYYEALCPGCQQFITGPLFDTLAHDDIKAIVDLKMVPYGNTKKNADGTFTCQHGADECTSDVLELCTLYKLSNNISSITTGDTSMAAFPFIHCMEVNEGAPSAAEGCFSDNMKNSGLAWSTVTDCAATQEKDVQNAGMTSTPSHDYVPWVLVDNTLLENTGLLLPTICKDYTGPAPKSCKRLYMNTAEKCMNK